MAYPSASLSNPITPLRLDPNGSSPNFKEWSYGVDKHLLSRKIEGICLKDVLLNCGKGKMPILPKKLSATATGEELKTHEESMSKYEESYSVWEQADAAIIGVFVGTTPSELVKTYHNYPSAHAIWEYLNDRFLNKTAVGVAILIPRMFQPTTNALLARFTLTANNLYTLQVPPSSTEAHSTSTTSSCSCRQLTDPTILYHHPHS
ncbi:hypothetical protein CLOP_g5612 [Closterium sp. NIES-67]|nr:hypothetical protein CLOP_g5612 [Closterium sp. NIES-67]